MDHLHSIKSILNRLQADPHSEQHQKDVQEAFKKHPSAVLGALKEQPAASPPSHQISPTAEPPADDLVWTNSVGQQKSIPLKKTKPQSLKELVEIVSSANKAKQRVRAVGSGHAFSDVASTEGAILVNPVLLTHVSAAETNLLRGTAGALKLVNIQAGITVQNLIEELDNRGLALINQGGYTGQTISGTISTGTHGSGITFGPLASFVRSLVLVSETGVVYQIEPSNGITDPTKFTGTIDGVSVVLKQDDEWFNTVQVAMGCIGIIYSITMEVVNAYSIKELRTSTTWEEVKKSLTPELWKHVPPIISSVDHFELVLNPYASWFRTACIKVERTRLQGVVQAQGQRQDWLSAALEQAAIAHAPTFIHLLNKAPFISPLAIDSAIMSLKEKTPFIEKSFNVFTLGAANDLKAIALELHCDATQCVPVIDKLLKVFQEESRARNWYMAGPLGIRFVAPSDAFLAPEAGRMTCTIELDMLVGVETGVDLAREVKLAMCGDDRTSVRVHWGLDLDFVTAKDVRAWYPEFERWEAVYKQLNSTGMFNNKFTDRMGISTTS